MTKNNELLTEARSRHEQIQREILRWASRNLRDFPWRRDRTPYKIIVAEFLLKRTTSTAVGRVYEDFLRRYPEIDRLAKADLAGLEGFLETIGYHKLRSKALKETAAYIIDKFGGRIPEDLDRLMSIPHVGPYTAGAILSLGYGKPAPMVDSNVERILKRAFLMTLPKKAVLKKLRQVAAILVPKHSHDTFNLALLDLGALVCTYRLPYCYRCPINRLCDTGKKTM